MQKPKAESGNEAALAICLQNSIMNAHEIPNVPRRKTSEVERIVSSSFFEDDEAIICEIANGKPD